MNIVFCILDDHDNTDNIIVINSKNKKLIWIPRDIYCEEYKNRINGLFSVNKKYLKVALNSFGFNVEHIIYLYPSSVDKIFKKIKNIKINIKKKLFYYYPIKRSYKWDYTKYLAKDKDCKLKNNKYRYFN